MSNEEVYAAGLLNRALDQATQPPPIQAFLQAELDLLQDVITQEPVPGTQGAATH